MPVSEKCDLQLPGKRFLERTATQCWWKEPERLLKNLFQVPYQFRDNAFRFYRQF